MSILKVSERRFSAYIGVTIVIKNKSMIVMVIVILAKAGIQNLYRFRIKCGMTGEVCGMTEGIGCV